MPVTDQISDMLTRIRNANTAHKEEVEIQRSFLDAFLKGEDRVGWSRPGERTFLLKISARSHSN